MNRQQYHSKLDKLKATTTVSTKDKNQKSKKTRMADVNVSTKSSK